MARVFDIWSKMDRWELVLPPSRPSLPQLRFFMKNLNTIDRDRPVAILGSTPEYRDMLAYLNFSSVFVFEKNRKFFQRTKNYQSRNTKETLVSGDWISMLPTYRNTFSAIFSDLTSGNIRYELQPEFYAAVSAALSKDGIFCDKILTHGERLIPLNLIYERFKVAPLNLLSANYLSCEGLFCSDVLRKRSILDTTAAYKELEGLSREGGWKTLIKCTKLITPEGGTWYYGKPWKKLGEVYSRHIRILKTAEDFRGSPYEGRVKLFVGRRP